MTNNMLHDIVQTLCIRIEESEYPHAVYTLRIIVSTVSQYAARTHARASATIIMCAPARTYYYEKKTHNTTTLTNIIGERERANLVVQLARIFYIYFYNNIYYYIAVSHLAYPAYKLRYFICDTCAESRKDYDVNFTYT